MHAFRWSSIISTATLVLLFHLTPASAQLGACRSMFAGSKASNAPHHKSVGRSQVRAGNTQICRRFGRRAVLAYEYNPNRFMPDWVAYRLRPIDYGRQRCGSAPRNHMRCYFKNKDVRRCVREKWWDDGNKPSGKPSPRDPFHKSGHLKSRNIPIVGTGAFSGTKHDRGHLAPNNAFSWHLCATYKTFTMANMAPQLANFNRGVWLRLEKQVLYWAVTEGPIFVVTGPIYVKFPRQAFDADRRRLIDRGTIVSPGLPLTKGDGTVVSPRIIRPTGFYKVIYRPKVGNRPAKAVAFLLPHTTQKKWLGSGKKLDYMSFISTIELVEKSSGLKFGILPQHRWGADNAFWMARRVPGSWRLRPSANSCPGGGYKPKGWFPSISRKKREALCATPDYDPPQ